MPDVESISEDSLIERAVRESIAEICEKPGCIFKNKVKDAALVKHGIIIDINYICRKEIILSCPYLRVVAKDRLTELMKRN